jgi:hypothetical protein
MGVHPGSFYASRYRSSSVFLWLVHLFIMIFRVLTPQQFFCLQLVGNISLIFGPVAQYHENSQYYSAIAPPPDPDVDRNLPHITIQCPVYKESLKETM